MSSAFALTVNPTNPIAGNEYFFNGYNGNVYIFTLSGSPVTNNPCDQYTPDPCLVGSMQTPEGEYIAVDTNEHGSASDYTQNFSYFMANYQTDTGNAIISTTNYSVIGQNTNSINNLIGNASSTFMATTGFTPSQGITSIGSMFIMPFIGGGIMLLQALTHWIIAIIVLSAFIYFSYRAFMFYMTKGARTRNGSVRVKKK